MYGKVLLGALVAVAAQARGYQEVSAQVVEVDIRIPDVEVYIPALEISALQVWIPELSFTVPGFDIQLPGLSDWETHPQDAQTDTTFAVKPGARLEVRNHAGAIAVSTWNRNAVRIQASHSSHDRVKIFSSESAVKVKSESRHGLPDLVDYRITVPKSMALDLWGFHTDMTVDGVQNGVRAETLNGSVQVSNSGGELSVRSVEGEILVQRSRGRLEVNNVENQITITDFEGKLFVESIDGDIRLERIRADEVEAKTVDGSVFYQGSISDSGRYRLTTHDGDVEVAVPEGVNATVSVATFDGTFEAEFPIQISRAEATRRFSFVLGKGSARLDLHSFDGSIRLVRR